MRNILGFFAILAITTGPCSNSAESQTAPAGYQHNASFLSRRFLTDPTNAPALIDDFLVRTDKFYKTPILLPNGGLLSSAGILDHAPGAAKIFLDHVSAYESANGVSFTLMPYLNGYSLDDTAHAANFRLDLGNPMVRAAIVAECGRYVSATVMSSYVARSKRMFDGIVIDIEPSGNPVFLASLKTLLVEIRASFDGMGLKAKKIGVAAPQHTDRNPKPNWGWNSSDYYSMARSVDYVVAMTYDSASASGPNYRSWIHDQTTRILQSVSGAVWNFDSAHPQPRNGVRVLIGLPGFYALTKAHDPNFENVSQGAPGIRSGLSLLRSTDATSLSYFEGATMFTHDGGAADSNYARYDKDWSWWQKDWREQ